MPPRQFKCKQCGHCCLNLLDAYCTSVPEEDIQVWRREGREDILAWVVPLDLAGGEIIGYDVWISPKTGEEVNRCPWLRRLPNKEKYICRIHDVKPRHCRDYPKSRKQAEETGCEGFEG